MPRVIRRNVLLALCFAGALMPVSARATGIPSGGNTTTPGSIRLVGSDGTSPSQAFGQFEVIIRDFANYPIVNALVEVDFSHIPDLFIASAQVDPDMAVDCIGRKVSKLTDANGRVVFCILGASSAASPPVTLLGGGRIYANSTLIGDPTVSAFDLDGQHGLGAGDLVKFLDDFASGLNYGRSDFDATGIIGAGDLAVWLKAFSSGSQIVSAGVVCP